MTTEPTSDPSAQPEGPRDEPPVDPSTQPDAPAKTQGAVPDDLDAEIDAAMAELGFGAAAATGPGRKPPIRGPRVVEAGREHRSGTVVSVGDTDLFIEFGPKELGVAPRTQWKEGEDLPAVGEHVEVVVDRFEPDESIFICSRPGAVVKAAWELLDVGQIVEARVTGTNKGGLELEVGGHRAFMPAGQVALERIEDLSTFVGEKLTCEVAQLDRRGRGNIVLSRRNMLRKERAEKAASLKDALKEGDTIEGTVRKIMPFGAFVDLGGLDGLIHISDLSHDRIGYGEKAIEKVLSEGQAVTVRILQVDWEKNRISLGLKQLQEDPFTSAAESLVEGSIVSGTVKRLTDFGAFVEVATGVEGLVHISEIAHRRINHPKDELKEGEVVQVKILKVDPSDRKLSLSIRATTQSPEDKKADQVREQDSKQLRRLREKFGKQDFKGGLG